MANFEPKLSGDEMNDRNNMYEPPREVLRRRIREQRVLLDHAAAIRANHIYEIIKKVHRDILVDKKI
ncbi:MAG: hypothetical protein JW787_11555 [Sedimentisphaerales bacterium]|nr:hypothetical protein [Sedimentisphaerales bacterium]